jgi:hypothetical protein
MAGIVTIGHGTSIPADSTLRIDLKLDRTSPVYLLYFGSRRPSELKRPHLGTQLEIMRGWPTSLQTSDSTVLQQLGTQRPPSSAALRRSPTSASSARAPS